MSFDRDRNAYLDALRGVAVLIVILSHGSNEDRDLIPFLNLQGTGKMGVWLFFVLSAFLLTRKLTWELENETRGALRTLVRYGINRIFRIFPLYLLVVFAHAVRLSETGGVGVWHFFWRQALLLDGQREFWVIPVEMKYYAVIPVFCLLHIFVWRRRFEVAAAVWASIAVFCIWRWNLSGMEKNSLLLWPYFPIFAVGSLLAVAPARFFRWWGSSVAAAVSVALCAFFLVSVLAHSPTITMPRLYAASPLLALLGSTILAWGLVRRRVRPLPLLSLVGRISFSIYLLHYPVLKTLIRHPFLPPSFQGPASALLVLALAWGMWRLVEEPCIAFGKRLGGKLTGRVVPTPHPDYELQSR